MDFFFFFSWEEWSVAECFHTDTDPRSLLLMPAACEAEIYFAAAGDFSKPLHFYQVFQATLHGSGWTRRFIEGLGVANTVESTGFRAAIQLI